MQTRQTKTKAETRAWMISQGLNPETCRNLLKDFVRMEREVFEIMKPSLNDGDCEHKRQSAIQAELLLSFIDSACLVQSLP